MAEELAAVQCDLQTLAAEMFEPFTRADQRGCGALHLRGLLLDGRRKSVEPMAARPGKDGKQTRHRHPIGGHSVIRSSVSLDLRCRGRLGC
ncbi:transposase [Streptomyces sp. NPDC008092]|uniref:transposase n=1 Tax=Streptomyces sp. NPDC008092 TaxID=3364808 RepID=UPI0036EA4461